MKIKIYYIFGSLILSYSLMANTHQLEMEINKCHMISNDNLRLNCFDQLGTFNKKSTTEDGNLNNKVSENITHDTVSKTKLKTINNSTKSQSSKAPKFPVLLADLEEPRIFSAVGNMDFRGGDFSAILLGIGTRLTMKTFDISPRFNNIDFNVIGMIKSQFDVSDISTRNNRGGALINTDFMVGGELIKPFDQGALRIKYIHRSTHLGDEFIIDNPEFLKDRLNLSYETLDITAFHQIKNFQTYYGGSYVLRSEPGALGELQIQTGVQYKNENYGNFAPVIGIDLKSWQANDWHINASLKAGVEFSHFLNRPIQVLFEYFEGKSPYGQFIDDDLTFYGLSVNHYWD